MRRFVHRALRQFLRPAESFHKIQGLVSFQVAPATAAGICAFAFASHGVYLETNVRTAIFHELYPQAEGVTELNLPAGAVTCPAKC